MPTGDRDVGTDRDPVTGRRARRSRRVRAATVLTGLALTLAACAGPGDVPPGVTPGGTGGAPDATDAPVRSAAPLLSVHSSGGFLPFGMDFARVPELTVYADGRAVTHGPQIAIYPPPALPNLTVRDLTQADLDALVAEARRAGLLGAIPDYGHPPVADVPTTFVRLSVDGAGYAHAAEALVLTHGSLGASADEEGAAAEEGPPGDSVLHGLTEEQRAARAALAAFVQRAHELVGLAPERGPYAIEAFAVTAMPTLEGTGSEGTGTEGTGTEGTGSEPAPEHEPGTQVLAWPLDVALADARECVVVDGAQAATLLGLLQGATGTTQFEQGGVRYEAGFRPLLPHEEGCDDL